MSNLTPGTTRLFTDRDTPAADTLETRMYDALRLLTGAINNGIDSDPDVWRAGMTMANEVMDEFDATFHARALNAPLERSPEPLQTWRDIWTARPQK